MIYHLVFDFLRIVWNGFLKCWECPSPRMGICCLLFVLNRMATEFLFSIEVSTVPPPGQRHTGTVSPRSPMPVKKPVTGRRSPEKLIPYPTKRNTKRKLSKTKETPWDVSHLSSVSFSLLCHLIFCIMNCGLSGERIVPGDLSLSFRQLFWFLSFSRILLLHCRITGSIDQFQFI